MRSTVSGRRSPPVCHRRRPPPPLPTRIFICPENRSRNRVAPCAAQKSFRAAGEERYCRDCWDKKIAIEEIVAREFALKRYIRAQRGEG